MRYLMVCAALLAVLVAVAVYAAFIADDGSAKFTVSDDPATTTTAGAGRGEPPTDTATPTAMPTFPEIGVATDGALAFSVDSVEFTPTVSSADFPIEKTAAGEFVVVHMEVTNTSDEPVTFLGAFQKLMADGAVYPVDDVATFYTGGALVELDPGDHADIAVVFDVPPGTDPETIELHTDPLGPGVELPLPSQALRRLLVTRPGRPVTPVFFGNQTRLDSAGAHAARFDSTSLSTTGGP